MEFVDITKINFPWASYPHSPLINSRVVKLPNAIIYCSRIPDEYKCIQKLDCTLFM
jgi:hypothetical protein